MFITIIISTTTCTTTTKRGNAWMSTRWRIKRGRKTEYVVRDKKGRFVAFHNIGRSIRADIRVKARHNPRKKRRGHLGDYFRRRWKYSFVLSLQAFRWHHLGALQLFFGVLRACFEGIAGFFRFFRLRWQYLVLSFLGLALVWLGFHYWRWLLGLLGLVFCWKCRLGSLVFAVMARREASLSW